jgi:hypothetical protein
MIVVADASPITALLHLNKLELLIKLYEKIIIPQSVALELQSLNAFGYSLSFLRQVESYSIIQCNDLQFMELLQQHLDAGESEAIALAKELHADWLLIDEKLGTKYAKAENIPCKGVIGVLIEAKLKGLIPAVKPLLETLQHELGFRISEKILMHALKKAGE